MSKFIRLLISIFVRVLRLGGRLFTRTKVPVGFGFKYQRPLVITGVMRALSGTVGLIPKALGQALAGVFRAMGYLFILAPHLALGVVGLLVGLVAYVTSFFRAETAAEADRLAKIKEAQGAQAEGSPQWKFLAEQYRRLQMEMEETKRRHEQIKEQLKEWQNNPETIKRIEQDMAYEGWIALRDLRRDSPELAYAVREAAINYLVEKSVIHSPPAVGSAEHKAWRTHAETLADQIVKGFGFLVYRTEEAFRRERLAQQVTPGYPWIHKGDEEVDRLVNELIESATRKHVELKPAK